MAGRRRLRRTFDDAAATYYESRPKYPAVVFDRLDAAIGDGAAILEVGPGPGIATVELARRGHQVTAIELGEGLADELRRRAAIGPEVTVHVGSFDDWEPSAWGAYDAVVAATAWHWLDPATKYQRARRHLRNGGVLAFWSALHVFPDGGDSIFIDLQHVYDEIGESVPEDWVFPRPGELPVFGDEIEESGVFRVEAIEHFDWELTYDADGYIALLDTFSGHIAMEPWKRDRLDSAIREILAGRPDGLLRRHWGAALHVARAV